MRYCFSPPMVLLLVLELLLKSPQNSSEGKRRTEGEKRYFPCTVLA